MKQVCNHIAGQRRNDEFQRKGITKNGEIKMTHWSQIKRKVESSRSVLESKV